MTKEAMPESGYIDELRKRAEEKMKKSDASRKSSQSDPAAIEYELRTHQIELEMQNEDLRIAQLELEKSRDRLADLYDNAPVGYVTITAKGLIAESNRQLARMLGTTRHDLCKLPFSSVILSDDQDVYYRCRRDFLAGTGRSSCELRITREGHDPFWAKIDMALGEPSDDGDADLRVIISDIDAQKQAQRRELAVREKLADTERMAAVSVLAAGVAHDLNNLLGPILALPDIIEKDIQEVADVSSPAKDSILECLGYIREAARLSSAVVSDLSHLSAQGQYRLEPLDVCSLDCFTEDSGFLAASRNRPEVQVSLEMADTELIVMGSAINLSRSIANLINNALDSISAAGLVSIRVSRIEADSSLQDRLGASPGDYAAISIKDNGCGISDEDRGHIFEPFYTRKVFSSSAGCGLGLSIVAGAIKAHDGCIDVQSEIGRGSTFTVYLPLVEEERTAVAKPQTTPIGGEERILVVDDTPGQRFLCKTALQKMGYHSEAVSSGIEAVALFKNAKESDGVAPFDLIVLDMIMEDGFDGLRTFDAIRELYPLQKALIISGFSGEDAIDEAASRDLVWLAKPFTLPDLYNAVRAQLDARPYRHTGLL